MPLKSKGFIAEAIEVQFDKPPVIEKKPPCPDAFTWRGDSYRVLESARAVARLLPPRLDAAHYETG